MTILVVGKWADISKGDLQGRATMEQFGPAIQLPMRDPISLKPIATSASAQPAPTVQPAAKAPATGG